MQWLAACPEAAVKTMLQDFGHPDLPTFAAAIFQQPPDYQHLTDSVRYAEADAETFRRTIKLLEQAGVSLKNAPLLDLACGPLAAQTLLFNSAGYKIVGADLHIPPAYLPTASLAQRLFQRGKYVKAWETATTPYYQALAQYSGLKLKWKGVKIELADLTRLPFPDRSFEVVVCLNHLHHAPDVESLLAEAVRVLQPGGVLVANIVPYPALTGAFSADGASPWSHLRHPINAPQPNSVILNRWRERQYRLAFEKFFQVEQWQAEANPNAMAQLTPTVRAELADYDEAELTCQQVVVIARKR
jgi:SAM-dependent methyltransferase